MWSAYVYFGPVANIYFIEGVDQINCEYRLLAIYGLAPPNFACGQSFNEDKLDRMLELFNVKEEDLGNVFADREYHIQKLDVVVRKNDGEFCKFCGNFFGMSEPNQTDGTLVCWSCRTSNKWKL